MYECYIYITTNILLFLLTVLYNYKPDTRYGLSLEIGETVQILEECQGN